MTRLAEIIKKQIIHGGPIPISHFMEACLIHPEYGYYTNTLPIGRVGDFTTAPEISQMFGELIGLFLSEAWINQKNNQIPNLVELGPGRGTLASDIMRVTKQIESFPKKIYLLEISKKLRAVQREVLAGYDVEWINSLDDLPEGPLIIVSNEFFDSLPINQYVRSPNGWYEKLVGVKSNKLIFGLSNYVVNDIVPSKFSDLQEGSLIEVRPSSEPIIRKISDIISLHGGLSLIIDYGNWGTTGNTLQAVSNHKFDDPLKSPGTVDLTAHVDFASLVQNISNCSHTKLENQGIFLERLGITERAIKLNSVVDKNKQLNHISAHRRLIHPDEMGTLFKVIALFPHEQDSPPGLIC